MPIIGMNKNTSCKDPLYIALRAVSELSSENAQKIKLAVIERRLHFTDIFVETNQLIAN